MSLLLHATARQLTVSTNAGRRFYPLVMARVVGPASLWFLRPASLPTGVAVGIHTGFAVNDFGRLKSPFGQKLCLEKKNEAAKGSAVRKSMTSKYVSPLYIL